MIFVKCILTKYYYSLEEYVFVNYLVKNKTLGVDHYILEKYVTIHVKDKDLVSLRKTMKHYHDFMDETNFISNLFNDSSLEFTDEIVEIFIEKLSRKRKDEIYYDCLFIPFNNKLFYVDYYEKHYPNYLPVLKLNDKIQIDKETLLKLEDRENFEDFISLNRDRYRDEETKQYIENYI